MMTRARGDLFSIGITMTSGEVLDERRHNYLLHESGAMVEYPVDTVPLNDIGGIFAESYAEGRGFLHAHLRVGSEGNDEFRDYCAIIERFREELRSSEVTSVRAEDCELVRCGCGQMRQPVLVACSTLSALRDLPSVMYG